MMNALLNSILLNALLATTLAVVVWVTGFIPTLRRRPGLRHGLWIVVLLKLVTPPLFELPILPGWLVAKPAPMLHPIAIPLDSLPGVSSVSAGDLRPELQPLAARNATGNDWLSIAAILSGFGTLSVLTFATCQIWRLRRALRGGATNDERLGRIGCMAADRMGLLVVPTVCVVAANVSPLLWVRRSGPLIVLPRQLVAQFTDEQLGCVLSHEIAHYLRRDHWTNLLSLIVAAVCWWNPIAWWARRELRLAQEACCDALVISRAVASRRKYAETLLQALEFIQAERSLLPALASGFGGKSSTERRFEMIANPKVSHRLSWSNYALLIAALAVLPCLLTISEAQEVAPIDLPDVAASDATGGKQKQLNERLRTPQFPLSAEDRQALMDFFSQGEKLVEQERSEEELLKAINQLERALKRVKEDRNKRDQGGKESDEATPGRAQGSVKPIGVSLYQWGQVRGDDGFWHFHERLKVKDCRSCHRFGE